MTKKLKIFLSCITILILLCSLVLSCSAAIADISSSIIVERLYYTESKNGSLNLGASIGIENGYNSETDFTMHAAEVNPNYFVDQFTIKSSDGLPLTDTLTYKFSLSNLYNYINIEDGSYLSGIHTPVSTRTQSIKFYYVDGSSNSYDVANFDSFSFNPSPDNDFYSFEFTITPDKPVRYMNVRLYYETANFGLPWITDSTDLWDWQFIIGCQDFKITREQVFPSPDSGAIDNFHKAETDALNKAQDGIAGMDNVFSIFKGLIIPGRGLYNGILFFGNLMRDFSDAIPDLSDILWISLALGLCMVIVAGVTSVVSRRKGD